MAHCAFDYKGIPAFLLGNYTLIEGCPMLYYSNGIKTAFLNCLNSMADNPRIYTNSLNCIVCVGIGTTFRDIKYTLGLTFFYRSVKQPIFFNFIYAVIEGIVCNKKNKRFAYQICLPLVLALCVEYIRCRRNRMLFRPKKHIIKELIPICYRIISPRQINTRTIPSFLYR